MLEDGFEDSSASENIYINLFIVCKRAKLKAKPYRNSVKKSVHEKIKAILMHVMLNAFLF